MRAKEHAVKYHLSEALKAEYEKLKLASSLALKNFKTIDTRTSESKKKQLRTAKTDAANAQTEFEEEHISPFFSQMNIRILKCISIGLMHNLTVVDTTNRIAQ